MQDEGLDVISERLDMLKNIALDMNEEIDRRAPLMDEIDSKVDQTTSDIRKNNVTLKQTITQIRSGRNFSIDITLLCIILGIAFYLNK
ncbi:syntaxin of plants 71 [Hibiscus trionum]|uniref:Syntaxin of plants 71 n=1 Tax=Hibiscus trionum TaxID=183268 RepID=A0A9W7H671_HIBTR|nr:syntaxin of plants 71 [Hibiscus trionum]